MNAIASVVIVGGGIAGVTTARELRSGGFAGTITIVESEPACYDRPPLTKAAFVDAASLESLAFATPEEYAAQHIDVLTGVRATAIVRGERPGGCVRLADGRTLDADAIVLATGVRAHAPTFDGGALPEVSVLRVYADALRVRELATPGATIVVVGAGLIGAELTSGLVALGAHVVLVDPQPVPGAAGLGETLAGYLHGLHAAHGVDVRQATVTAVTARDDGVLVALDDGGTLPAHAVVVGAGIAVDPALPATAGLADPAAGGSIVVDAAGRTTSPGVWAAGDATWRRAEDGSLAPCAGHWEAARLDGVAVAADILGTSAPARGADWYWSDRYGAHIEVVGRLVGDGTEVVRWAAPGRPDAVFRVADGLLVGAASVDDPMTVRAARRLIDQRVPVAPDRLADPAVRLRDLLRGA
ncbi:MAG TPA: FAD-dependent oxidoreductase [Microbacteriaceae bacterium]|nr:FAD-dependent oxidoreductase [Microbacteriaceae bacterium]